MSKRIEKFNEEFELFNSSYSSLERWAHLERLHILGQTNMRLHIFVHWKMLTFAIQEQKYFELSGQIFRIFLVPLGHLFNRLPMGNIGTIRVSAFSEMEVPEDLKQYVD